MTHRPRKRFGQNFLHDPAIIGRIVQVIHPQPGDHLIEIGPGQGAITLPLLQAAGHMDVVELDRDLLDPLMQKCRSAGVLTLHNADALHFDFCSLEKGTKLRVIGNLPYNISTPLLFHLLDQSHCIKDMHFMLQKEVVERMAAQPGTSAWGRLGVMLQFRCRVEPLFTIGPDAFRPEPKVESAFVRLEPYTSPPVAVEDETVFGELVRQAFAQRRKTLRNTLRGMLNADEIHAVGIDPGLRAETLSLAQFAALANRVVMR